MELKSGSLKKTARYAGLLYLFITIMGLFGLIYIPSQIIMVPGDNIASTNNILSHEFLFRLDIAISQISLILFVFLVLTLYRLFKHLNEYQAKLMVILVIVQIPIGFILDILEITSLVLLKGEVMKAFSLEQRQDIAQLLLIINKYGTIVLEVFWGLWLIPFGQLVNKSGFIPRIFGIYLIINGIAYILLPFSFILIPDFFPILNQYSFPFLLGEIAIMLWLLIKGVKNGTAICENNAV